MKNVLLSDAEVNTLFFQVHVSSVMEEYYSLGLPPV